MTLTEEQKANYKALADGGCCAPDDTLALLAHIAEQDAALADAEKANSVRPDYPVHCGQCGRAHVLDAVLPSEIWNKIASPDDLLCVVCIDTRLKKAGLTAEAEFYYSGDALRSRLYGDADALEAANKRAVRQIAAGVTDDQIDHMVDRFLNWKLPENFNPDGGISFQKTTNENTPWPHKSEPVGTNLFDAQQAKAMVLHMVEGLHCKPHNEHAADEARALSARLEAETKRADEAEAALERDRSIVAAHTTAMLQAIINKQWLFEGRGPYEWDDDRYREEFGTALKEIEAPIERLRAIARDWTNCPTDPEKMPARIHESELTALKARVAELEGALKCGIGHIEHMARWITDQKAGYSFEALGEDRSIIYVVDGEA